VAATDEESCAVERRQWTGQPLLWLALLTPAVLLIHGYHPFADDGAIYATGIKKLRDSNLYRADAVFALSPTRFSLFAHLLAPLAGPRSVLLPGLLLACHLLSIFLCLFGAWRVGRRIFVDRVDAWGSVLLVAACFTLPVAGTSLSIMDPYVTARSFSTPLGLFALAEVLDQKWARVTLWLTLAALLHPLMAGYSAIAVFTLALARRGQWRIITLLGCAVWLLCAIIFLAAISADPADPYNRATLSRSYFFLSSWRWYEYPGLGMPLLLLAYGAARSRGESRCLALSAAIVGACGLFVSFCFVHRSGSLLLARIQVLRVFQFVYLAGVILGGGFVANAWRKYPRLVATLYVLVVASLFIGQRHTYPESNHVEWPGMRPRNQWQQAFLWIRANTPVDAVFALDNDYIESTGEDAHGFRACAERSMVADWFKDGGIASNFRPAAKPWWQGAQATARLNEMDDPERLSRLASLGATWIVLPREAASAFSCPFVNARVRVCRLAISQGNSAK
jgi:hypothetical protein